MDVDRIGADQLTAALDHLHPFAPQHIGVLGGGDLLDHAVQPGHRLGERRAPVAVGDQRLGRHAAGEGAVATDRTVGDEQRRRTSGNRLPGGAEPRRTAADDDQVCGHGAETLRLPWLFRRPVGIMADVSGFRT